MVQCRELTIAEMLADPIVIALMAADRVQVKDARQFLIDAAEPLARAQNGKDK
jgi:hypothetical protein